MPTLKKLSNKYDYCGGKGSKIPVPEFIFSASCKKHDEGYLKGGNEIKRHICDIKFYWYMVDDCKKYKSKKLKYFYFRFWAYIYFKAVRIFGKKYFNYKK